MLNKNLKKMLPRIKYIFVLKTKEMFHLIKKLFLSFTQFSNLISYRRSFTVLSTVSIQYQIVPVKVYLTIFLANINPRAALYEDKCP